MINTDIQPKAVLDLKADSLGDWQIDLPKDLPDGVHTILVTDELGEEQDVAFVSVGTKEKTQFVDRVQEITPTWMIYAVLFFLVVILALAGNNLRLAWKKKRLSKKEASQLTRYSVGLSFASILISLAVGGLLIFNLIQAKNEQLTISSKQADIMRTNEQSQIMDRISGAVINPRDMSLVKNVSLSYKETEIKTTDGGNFVFTNVEPGDYLKLDNSDLPTPVYFRIHEDRSQYWDLFFDKDLYLLLINVAEAEKNNEINYIYANLADEIKQNKEVIDFVENYSKLFDDDFDTLRVDRVRRINDFSAINQQIYSRVYEFVLNYKGNKKVYQFVLENLNWKLVE